MCRWGGGLVKKGVRSMVVDFWERRVRDSRLRSWVSPDVVVRALLSRLRWWMFRVEGLRSRVVRWLLLRSRLRRLGQDRSPSDGKEVRLLPSTTLSVLQVSNICLGQSEYIPSLVSLSAGKQCKPRTSVNAFPPRSRHSRRCLQPPLISIHSSTPQTSQDLQLTALKINLSQHVPPQAQPQQSIQTLNPPQISQLIPLNPQLP